MMFDEIEPAYEGYNSETLEIIADTILDGMSKAEKGYIRSIKENYFKTLPVSKNHK